MTDAPFAGLPAATFDFLQDITANNNKAWFEAHKARFKDDVQLPALGLVVALGERLQARFPLIHYDLRTNGSGSLMRQYRDTRFSADKSPYKTTIAMMFTAGMGKKMEAPGFGLQISTAGVDLVAGLFGFTKPQLEEYRAAVLNEHLGGELNAAFAETQRAGNYTLGGATYKRVPPSLDAKHPRAEWLKFTGLHLFSPILERDIAQSPALVDVVMTHYENMAPITRWLIKALNIS